MKYEYRYVGGSEALSKGTVSKKSESGTGEIVAVRPYGNEYAPKAHSVIRPQIFRGRIDIRVITENDREKGKGGITQKELESAILALGIVGPGGTSIRDVDVNDATLDVWKSKDLSFKLNHKGDIVDDTDPVGKLLLEVARSNNRVYFPDEQERPMTLDGIDFEFVVYSGSTEIMDSETEKSYDLMFALNKMDRNTKVLFGDLLGLITAEMSDEDLEKKVYTQLIGRPNELTLFGITTRRLFNRLKAASKQELSATDIFYRGYVSGSIVKEDGKYHCKEIYLGEDPSEVVAFLLDEDNKEKASEVAMVVDLEE